MHSRTQLNFGLQSDASYNNRNNKLGHTTTNLTKLLNSEHERELTNNTMPPRLLNSRENESRKHVHTISYVDVAEKESKESKGFYNSLKSGIRTLNNDS